LELNCVSNDRFYNKTLITTNFQVELIIGLRDIGTKIVKIR